jgi:PBSX family phage terminase large subunit
MNDNLSLDEVIKARYRAMYTGVFFKRYILGLWVAAEGVIYDLFANDKSKFIVEEENLPPIRYATIGVDFGGTGSAHSFTLTGFTYNWDVVVLDEYYHNNKEKGRLSPEELTNAFVDFVKRAQLKYKVYEAYCDSAEQTLIEGFSVAVLKNRLPIEVRNALKGSINDRIAFYNTLMAQGRFKVCSRCTALISALENAVFSGKDPTQDERLDDGTVNVDSLDSLEYSTESIMNDIIYTKGM